jgi:FixJ family two-component response regulator
MKRLLKASHMQVETFATPAEFLESPFREHNVCLIVDVNGSDDGCLEIQKTLRERGASLPVIFMTTFETDDLRNRLKEGGAVGYFRKPIDEQALLDSIRWALSGRTARINVSPDRV